MYHSFAVSMVASGRSSFREEALRGYYLAGRSAPMLWHAESLILVPAVAGAIATKATSATGESLGDPLVPPRRGGGADLPSEVWIVTCS
jgi:hypothetical protein